MAQEDLIWNNLELALQAMIHHIRKSDRIKMIASVKRFVEEAEKLEETRN